MAEAATHLRLGESTLRRLIAQGKVPRHLVTRIGGKMFLTGDQIVRVIELGAAEENAPQPKRAGRHAPRKKKAAA